MTSTLMAERLRKLGIVDTTFAIRVGDVAERVVFDGFDPPTVEAWDGVEPVDFVLSAPAETWREVANGRSLNSLVIDGAMTLTGDDQLQVDNFYRYNASVQTFLELR